MAVFAYPDIDPIAFSLGPVPVHWYGLAYLAGFLGSWYLLRLLDRRWGMNLTADGRLEILFAAVIGVVVGARLGYVLVYSEGAWLEDPLYVLRTWEGGMSFHGGLAGILVAALVEAKRLGVPFLRLCDAGAVGAPIGLFFGRIANFINGELWGRTTGVPWGVVFPGAGPEPRHPSQLYEAGLEGLVIFAVMIILSRRRRPDGLMIGTMMSLYAVFRIAVEFFREPDAQMGLLAGGATMGQILSVPLLVAGVWLVGRALRLGEPAAEGTPSD